MSDASAGSRYGHVPDGPPQLELYDHGTAPGEFVNLADHAEHAARRSRGRWFDRSGSGS